MTKFRNTSQTTKMTKITKYVFKFFQTFIHHNTLLLSVYFIEYETSTP
jgi:hypothetical protein